LEIYNRDDYYESMNFLLAHQDDYKSIIVDNGDLLFAQVMQDFEDEIDGEIKGKHWRAIKSPWNSMLFKIGRSKQNFVMTTGRRDINYTTEDSGIVGVEGKLTIIPQDTPHVEKNVPRFVDLILKTDIQKNKLNQPTNIHTVTFVGGRRPSAVSPADLHTGKVWKFDSKAVPAPNVWNAIIAPLDAKWDENAVEHLGIDPGEARAAEGEMKRAFMEQEVGRLVGIISACKDAKTFPTVFRDEIQAPLNALDEEFKRVVIESKDAKKKELGIK
jgi:hypothetical protein